MSSKGASGTTTSTGTTTPWEEEQPYLKDIFKYAEDLYLNNDPEYYPDSTYAPMTGSSSQALRDTADLAKWSRSDPTSIANTSIDANRSLVKGDALNSNPGYLQLAGLQSVDPTVNAGTTLLTEQAENPIYNPATGYLSSFADVNPATTSDASNTLDVLSKSDAATNNVAGDTLALNAGTNFGTSANNEGSGYLKGVAAGDRLTEGNPYTADLADSVLTEVVPEIESQFIAGGTLASPETVRATTAGSVAGLAPSLFKNYADESENQVTAAGTLSSNVLKGSEGQTTAAKGYGDLVLGGIGYNTDAANDLLKGYLTGSDQQIDAATTLGDQSLEGGRLQQTAATELGDQAISGYTAQGATADLTSDAYNAGIDQQLAAIGLAPDTQKMPYTDLAQLYTAGDLERTENQNILDEDVARWNWEEELPYEELNQLIGAITGNYGGSTTLTQPYFDNSTSSTLGTAASAASLASWL